MSEWISVKAVLPPQSKKVIVYVPSSAGGIVDIGRWMGVDGWVLVSWSIRPDAVTYWMPLPEPPGEKKELSSNADRIRSMSDGEMASFLCNFRDNHGEGCSCNNCVAADYCRAGHTGMIDWLKQPAEVGK